MSNFRIEIDTEQKSLCIYNGKCMWTKLTYQDKSDYDKLSIDILLPITHPDTLALVEHVEKLRGGKNKDWKKFTDDNGNEHIKLTASVNATDKNGKPRNVRLYDGDGNKVPVESYPKIGNFSTVNIRAGIGEWTHGKKQGVSFYLFSVQLLKLVPYEGPQEYEAVEDSWKHQQDPRWETDTDNEYAVDDDDEYTSTDYGDHETDEYETDDSPQTESFADRIRRKADAAAKKSRR